MFIILCINLISFHNNRKIKSTMPRTNLFREFSVRSHSVRNQSNKFNANKDQESIRSMKRSNRCFI